MLDDLTTKTNSDHKAVHYKWYKTAPTTTTNDDRNSKDMDTHKTVTLKKVERFNPPEGITNDRCKAIVRNQWLRKVGDPDWHYNHTEAITDGLLDDTWEDIQVQIETILRRATCIAQNEAIRIK